MSKPRILILCTGNSCRSHMAEGILRAAAGDLIEVHSAGSDPSGYVHPIAIAAMSEIGIDISGHHSKHMDTLAESGIHTIITVCGNANQACGVSPRRVIRHHWEFADPAEATGSNEEILNAFRSVRDQIRLVFEAYAAGMRDVGIELSSPS